VKWTRAALVSAESASGNAKPQTTKHERRQKPADTKAHNQAPGVTSRYGVALAKHGHACQHANTEQNAKQDTEQ
jgi:hypothetical protein